MNPGQNTHAWADFAVLEASPMAADQLSRCPQEKRKKARTEQGVREEGGERRRSRREERKPDGEYLGRRREGDSEWGEEGLWGVGPHFTTWEAAESQVGHFHWSS